MPCDRPNNSCTPQSRGNTNRGELIFPMATFRTARRFEQCTKQGCIIRFVDLSIYLLTRYNSCEKRPSDCGYRRFFAPHLLYVRYRTDQRCCHAVFTSVLQRLWIARPSFSYFRKYTYENTASSWPLRSVCAIALVNANAVIGLVAKDSNGDGIIDITTGDKTGATYALCHTITDGSVYA
jgi:hypothetical protein